MEAVKFVGGDDLDLYKEAEKYKLEQEKDLIIDFDQAVAEEHAESIKIKFQGAVYELPRKTPAWIPLFVNRHGKGEKNELSDKHNLYVIERLLGKDFADKIVEGDSFISFDIVNERILEPVFKQWGFTGASGEKK